VHIQALQDDPTATWKILATLFVQQKASTRFVAYEEFFSIRKCSDESLSVAGRDSCTPSFPTLQVSWLLLELIGGRLQKAEALLVGVVYHAELMEMHRR